MTGRDQHSWKATAVSVESSTILSVLTRLIDRLDSDAIGGMGIIPWSCPVPAFGDLLRPQVATLGINPRYREFLDQSGKQLEGESRRFHTLDSLGLERWADADVRHLELIMETFRSYFSRNPYDGWFRKLDFAIAGTNVSYYDEPSSACHLDLVPFATVRKWNELSSSQRASLLSLGGDSLGIMLRDSQVRVLILNGSTVVKGFQSVAGLSLEAKEIPAWSLGRRSRAKVRGIAYTGVADSVSGVTLDRPLAVLGFNHNLQSSFGVTMEVMSSIREWIAHTAEETEL